MSDVLDEPAVVARYDAAGMLGQIARLPADLRDAWARTRDLALPGEARAAQAVALLGMGGSAIGGDLVRDVFADRLRVPLVTVRGYELPAWVGPRTLVVASSYSGATEETISALEAALRRRCPVVILTTGGPLLEVARRAQLPCVTFPGGGQPRAAVGYAVGLLAGVLQRAGCLPLGDDEVEAAAAAAERAAAGCGPAGPTAGNVAKQLAWALVDRLPIVVASGSLAAVARRWKTQLNENGKTTAAWEELPEATHNAIVGYGQPESLQAHAWFVFLSGSHDHPRDRLRAELAAELLDEVLVGHQVVRPEPGGRLAEAIGAVVIGDFTSAYLAILYGLDPTPVEAIARVKARLAEAPPDGPGGATG